MSKLDDDADDDSGANTVPSSTNTSSISSWFKTSFSNRNKEVTEKKVVLRDNFSVCAAAY